ncbi:Fucose permease [Saccharopolyspora shandongensis]|uniref:Fucose permease n=1 Tax=Saccharopolyspora shandongensis TaxID=418495 RepID=A0A1H2V1M2_9PSEU|nr:MFS transporter [Saccharopolyspora shandongensis]SDW62262.1 Fucose permease [Saccharopolyspora shandongensis]
MVGGPAAGVRSRPFGLLLGAWAVSSVGDGIRAAALPLFTAVSTRDPVAVSAVAAATVLPWLLVALPAGAVVDRWRPRHALICAHAFRCAVTFALAALIHTGKAGLPALLVCGFLLSSAETFADSAGQTLLVSLAGSAELERANGRFVSVETAGVEIAGPLAAAALFAWDPALCFAANALALGLALLLVIAVPGQAAPVQERDATSLRAEVLAGLRFLVRSPGLRAVVGVVGVTALLTSGVNAVAFLFAIESLRLPAASVPTLLVCTAIGTLLAAPVASRLAGRLGGGSVMIGALFVLAAGIALLGVVRAPGGAWLAYFVMGLGAGAWNVLSAANRQRLTPRRMMGRVTSAHRVLAWGLMPLGAALAGPLAEVTSLRAVILGAALLTAAVAIAAAPRLRGVSQPKR